MIAAADSQWDMYDLRAMDHTGIGLNPFASRGSSGVRITPETALQCSAFLACVRVISESVASLPLHLFSRLATGGKQRAPEHPLYRLLHRAPNPWQTSLEFREQLTALYLMYGQSFALIRAGAGGFADQLWPLHPSRMRVEVLENDRLLYLYRDPRQNDREVPYSQEQIFHLRWLSLDAVNGTAPVELSRDVIGLARALEIHGCTYFSNGARPGVVLENDNAIPAEAAERLREQWERMHRGPDRAHRTAVLPQGTHAKELSGSNEAAQFLETRQHQVIEVCRIFRMPPHMIQDLTRSTYSNIEVQGTEFVQHCLLPHCRRWEAAISRDLLTDDQLFAEHSLTALLRGDSAARSTYYREMLNIGVLSVNEIRELENLNPIGPEGDQRFMQLNMTTLENIAAGEQPAAMEPPPVVENEESQEDDAEDQAEQEGQRSQQRNCGTGAGGFQPGNKCSGGGSGGGGGDSGGSSGAGGAEQAKAGDGPMVKAARDEHKKALEKLRKNIEAAEQKAQAKFQEKWDAHAPLKARLDDHLALVDKMSAEHESLVKQVMADPRNEALAARMRESGQELLDERVAIEPLQKAEAKARKEREKARHEMRNAVANTLAKEAAAVDKEDGITAAQRKKSLVAVEQTHKSGSQITSWAQEQNLPESVSLSQRESAVEARTQAQDFLRSAVNPTIHTRALEGPIEYKDGVRANAAGAAEAYESILGGSRDVRAVVGRTQLSPTDSASTVIHEFGHQIEHGNVEAARLCHDFLQSRVAGEQAVSFSDKFQGYGYGSDEQGSPDDFLKAVRAVHGTKPGTESQHAENIAHYAGKRYEGNGKTSPSGFTAYGATEVLSIGMELLAKDARAFSAADPEWFDLVSGIATGRILTKTRQQRKKG